ncbi:MAG: double-strand break repair helicase AddA, partial [Hyphomicrobiaceae bacterium]
MGDRKRRGGGVKRFFGTALLPERRRAAPQRHHELREETLRNQAVASDPNLSVWVSANAGTGKTHVLTNRVLRLLLAGTAPERILALTYTKAAAAEMSKRVFQRLAEWTTESDSDLSSKLTELIGRNPSPEEQRHARQLLARAIETPGGLKVQTIHAFCERLLKRFPLEAAVSPSFTILDDQQRQLLISQAVDAMLGAATADKSGALWAALETAIAYAVDGNFERLLGEALRLCASQKAAPGCELPAARGPLRSLLGVAQDATQIRLTSALANVLSEGMLPDLMTALRQGSTTDQDRAEDLARARAASTAEGRAAAFESLFLTQGKATRARLFTRDFASAWPQLATELLSAQVRFVSLHKEQQALTVVEATLALERLSTDVLARYAAAKARLAVLDFDDLVAKAAALLQSSAAVEWVLYKLDGGLDHILVDEAQDTSPVQWQVIRSLAAEFFSGEGARDQARTLFAVGDEKQSIYGFQGAAPSMFAAAGNSFAAAARQAKRAWQQ